MKVPVLWCSAVAILAAVGCGKKSSGGGGPSVTLGSYGGTVVLSNVSTGSSVTAQFYSSISPEPTPIVFRYATGLCVTSTSGVINPVSIGTPTVGIVGTGLTFTSGSTVVTAVFDSAQGVFFGGSTTALPGGSSWTVANSGGTGLAAGTIGTISIPSNLVVSGTPTVSAAVPLTLSWTGGTGAIDVVITLINAAQIAVCSAPNTGTFTVPALTTAKVGSGATVQVVAETAVKATVNGRDMLLVGSTP